MSFFESLREFNPFEWDPQLTRPEADGPMEDIREYDMHIGVAWGDTFLTNHPDYMVDQLISAKPETAAPEEVVAEAPAAPAMDAASEAGPVPDEESTRVINIAEARAKAAQAIAAHPPTEPTSYDLPKSA